MNIQIEDILQNAPKWEMKQAFSQIIHHHPDFHDPCAHDARLVNFKITLEPGRKGLPSNGRGSMTLPDRTTGEKFFRWAIRGDNSDRLCVHGRKLWLCASQKAVNRRLVEALNTTPYVDLNPLSNVSGNGQQDTDVGMARPHASVEGEGSV